MPDYYKCECGKEYIKHYNQCSHMCNCGKRIDRNYGRCTMCSIIYKK